MPDPHEADPHEARQRQGERLFRMASFRLAVLGMLLSSLGAILTFALIYGAPARPSAARSSPPSATSGAS